MDCIETPETLIDQVFFHLVYYEQKGRSSHIFLLVASRDKATASHMFIFNPHTDLKALLRVSLHYRFVVGSTVNQ